MKLSGRTILLLALIVFGGFAIFDFYQDKKKEEKTLEESRFMTLNFEQVDSIQIDREGQKIVIKRNVNGWELLEPYQDLADNEFSEDFVKNTFTERIIEVAAEGENIEWSRYGLDKPLGTIFLKTSLGEENVFEVSAKRNFEDNTFARRNRENRVLVVNSNWQNRAKKTAMEFRDRRFLRNKIASVDALKLENEKGVLEIQRIDGQWRAVPQKDLKLDQNKVRELLTTISEARASEIYSSSPVQGKKLFSLSLSLADKKWLAQVEQGQDLSIFAKVSEPQFKMKMEPGALDKMIKISLSDLKGAVSKEKQDRPEEADKNKLEKESK